MQFGEHWNRWNDACLDAGAAQRRWVEAPNPQTRQAFRDELTAHLAVGNEFVHVLEETFQQNASSMPEQAGQELNELMLSIIESMQQSIGVIQQLDDGYEIPTAET